MGSPGDQPAQGQPDSARTLRVFAPCAFTWANKGDAALVYSLLMSLDAEFGEVDVTLTSFTPELDERHYGVRVVAMPLAPYGLTSAAIHRLGSLTRLPAWTRYLTLSQLVGFLGAMWIWRRLSQRVPRIARLVLPASVRRAVDAIQSAEIVVAVPGGYLMAASGRDDHWFYHAATLGLTKILGKPLILAPCSIGPFPGIHRLAAALVLRGCDAILLRETHSRKHLRRLGIAPGRVHVLADLAFVFGDDARGASEIQGVLERLAPLQQPWIGISVRSHAFAGSDDPAASFDAYLSAMAETADLAVARLGASVVFVPQARDDVSVAADVFARMQHRDAAVVLTDDLSPYALKALYARLEVLVGTRMHANILALTSGTPVVAIAYEHKTVGIMEQLGLGLYVVPITATPEVLADALMRLWGDRHNVRSTLGQRTDRLRAAATETTEYIRRALWSVRESGPNSAR